MCWSISRQAVAFLRWGFACAKSGSVVKKCIGPKLQLKGQHLPRLTLWLPKHRQELRALINVRFGPVLCQTFDFELWVSVTILPRQQNRSTSVPVEFVQNWTLEGFANIFQSDYCHHFYTGHIVPGENFSVSLHSQLGALGSFQSWESWLSPGILKAVITSSK